MIILFCFPTGASALPRITLHPPHQTVHLGESASVNCSVTGEQPITVEWEAFDRPLPRSVSQNRGFLRFNEIQTSDAGKYLCKATNIYGVAEAVAEVFVSGINTQIFILANN